MMIFDTICIIAALALVLIIVFIIILWRYLKPDSPGIGAKHPYTASGPPPMAPGTHRTHVPAQGLDAVPSESTPLCPNCGGQGAFDRSKNNYYCEACKRWF